MEFAKKRTLADVVIEVSDARVTKF
jgi:hypothetical protein